MSKTLASLIEQPLIATVREIAHTRATDVMLVGGAVRDTLLGRNPHDFDFAVNGDAVGLARAVANALSGDFYILDAERGTARVLLPATVLDFARLRGGTTWRDDLFARDFSMNAIAMALESGNLLDDTSGLRDIEQRLVRATTDHAIADDPVRALRAVRMAFQFGFEIEPATLSLVRDTGTDILKPSAERLRDEFFAILDLPNAAHAMQVLDNLGLLTHLVPEIEPMRTQAQSAPHAFSVLEHTWRVMEAVDEQMSGVRCQVSDQVCESLVVNLKSSIAEDRTIASLLRFAALLHDCAKPNTASLSSDGRIHFYGHERDGAAMAVARARAFKLSGDEVSWVRTIVANHMRPNQMARMPIPPTPRALVRFFRNAGECAPALALFAVADCWGKRGEATTDADCEPSRRIAALLLESYYSRFEKSVAPEPFITGRDVIALGVQPGRRIGEILEVVREAQMAGEIETREQAMEIARAMSQI